MSKPIAPFPGEGAAGGSGALPLESKPETMSLASARAAAGSAPPLLVPPSSRSIVARR